MLHQVLVTDCPQAVTEGARQAALDAIAVARDFTPADADLDEREVILAALSR